jgi:PAS domain S-box-containing protein
MSAPTSPADRSGLAFRQSRQAGILVAADVGRWTIEAVNDAYLAVTHRRREDLLGRPLFECFPESQATLDDQGSGRIAASFLRALAGEPALIAAQRYDLPIPGRAGEFEEHYWDFSTVIVRDDDGRILSLLHEVQDVTHREQATRERDRLTRALEEQNQVLQENAVELESQAEELMTAAAELEEQTAAAEEARRRAEGERARTERVLETMADAYFALDAEFRFTAVNGTMERYASTPRAEMLGRTIWAVFPTVLGTEFERAYRAAAAGRATHLGYDYGPEGHDLVVDLDAYPADGGGVVVFWRDVTAQTRAERALRESEAQLRTLANGLPTLAWTARADGFIEWYNDRWYEYTGTAPSDMEGWGWQSVHHPDTLDAVVREWTRSIATGEPFEMVFPLRAADGSYRRFLTRVTPLRDPSGQVLRWFGVNTDIEAEQVAREAVETVVESVTDGFVAVDAGLRYTYVNRRAAEMWGLPPSALVGRTPMEVWPDLEMSRTAFVQLFGRVLVSRRTETLQSYAPSLHRWIECRAYPSAEGGIVVFFQDLTERRRAEEGATIIAEASQLLASSTDYAETLSNVARAVVPRLGDWSAVDLLVDPGSATWPPALERVAVVHEDPRMLELGAELGRRYPERWEDPAGMSMVIREARPVFVPTVTDEMLVGSARDAEHLRLLRALRFASVIVVPIVARDRVLGTLTLCMTESDRHYTSADLAVAEDLGRRAGVALDTTRLLRDAREARAAAEAAADRTARLQHVTGRLAEALTEREVAELVVREGAPAFGATGGFVYLLADDRRTLELTASTGALPPEFSAMQLDDDLPLPEAVRTMRSVVLESRDDLVARYPALTAVTALGSTRAWIAVAMRAGDVTMGGLALSFEAERRFDDADRSFVETLARLGAQALLRARLFEEAERARAMAEEANRAKMTFLATMSHELRTPLNAIAGHVQLMEMELHGPVNDEQRGALARVNKAQAHLLGLINDILTYAKVESGRTDYVIEPVDAVEVVREAFLLVEPQFVAKGVTLTLTAEHDAPVLVLADREKLGQVMLNLISNAWKFTPSGGQVTLSVRQVAGASVAAIVVSDTGVGVPADKLESIFEPFVQLGRGLNSAGQAALGTGLGLAISRDLARGMAGDLVGESRLGAGSVFTLTIPLA